MKFLLNYLDTLVYRLYYRHIERTGTIGRFRP